MKKLNFLVLLLLLTAFPLMNMAQMRFSDEVFSSVTTTHDTFGVNISIYPIVLGQSMTPLPVPLDMRVYEPTGDTMSKRPLIILLHSGTYLDPGLNRGASGTIDDSVLMEMATRWARMGYVVASVDNRKGWNPTSMNVEVKRKTVLEATYRAIQDARTAVRFFRATAAGAGNPYRIDPDKIVMGGDGTGGYIAYGVAFVKRYDQINLLKFQDFTDPMNPVPYVDSALMGDPYGLLARPLNNPNHVGVSSDIQMGFALGGAAGDSSWMEPGDPPFAALHTIGDRLAPYMVNDVTEPVNNDVVIPTASGAYTTISQNNYHGNNDVWKGIQWADPYNIEAATKNDGIDGLFPLDPPFTPCMRQCITSIPNAPMDTCEYDGAPWQWYNEVIFANFIFPFTPQSAQITAAEEICLMNLGNPNDAARARTYIDTIVGFLTPRIVIALGLPNNVAIDELKEITQLKAYPNPASSILKLQAGNATPMRGVEVFDAMGRLVYRQQGLHTNQITITREGWTSGLYMVKVHFDRGSVVEKVIFE